MGVTVRELNGWTPRTVTVDAKGSIVSVTVAQSRFSPTDVALLLASRRADLEHRGDHGWLMSEATDPKNRGKFFPEPPIVDFAKKALIEGRESAEKIFKGKIPLDALIIKVGKKP